MTHAARTDGHGRLLRAARALCWLALALPAAAPAPAQQRRGPALDLTLGLSAAAFDPDSANAAAIAHHGIGFQGRLTAWLTPAVGLRTAFGVDFFRGPDDQYGRRPSGSYGVADAGLALRAPRVLRVTPGLDGGVSGVFEAEYGFSGGYHIGWPDGGPFPMRAGVYLEPSLRFGGRYGVVVAYRRYFAAPPTAASGRLRGRVTLEGDAALR